MIDNLINLLNSIVENLLMNYAIIDGPFWTFTQIYI